MARISFKVAPGVRISASSRGVRTSIGNSKARVSYGGGRTYTSAKIAGVRVSESSSSRGNASRSSSSQGSSGAPATRRPTLAQLERAERAAAQESAIEDLRRLEESLVTLHHEEFPAAMPQKVQPPAPADQTAIRIDLEKSLLSTVSWFKFSQRRAAKASAAGQALQEAARIDAENADLHLVYVEEARQGWEQLLNHDVESVIEALEMAFADNASEATCVDAGVEDGVRFATVVVLFGSVDSVPERTPSVTSAGKPTTKKRNKTDRNALYVAALGSTVLATVREGFAAAPSVDEFRMVVLRKDLNAPTPDDFVAPIYAASFLRSAAEGLQWRKTDPTAALLAADDAQFKRKGAAGDVVGIGLTEHPGLAELVATFRPLVLS
jgi:hypothetical protein